MISPEDMHPAWTFSGSQSGGRIKGRGVMRKRKLHWLVTIALVVAICTVVDLCEAKTFPEIKAEELKDRLDAGEDLMMLNPLSRIEFDDKRIPGSVNIPLQEIMVADNLPADKDHLIVTYCLGPN